MYTQPEYRASCSQQTQTPKQSKLQTEKLFLFLHCQECFLKPVLDQASVPETQTTCSGRSVAAPRLRSPTAAMAHTGVFLCLRDLWRWSELSVHPASSARATLLTEAAMIQASSRPGSSQVLPKTQGPGWVLHPPPGRQGG